MRDYEKEFIRSWENDGYEVVGNTIVDSEGNFAVFEVCPDCGAYSMTGFYDKSETLYDCAEDFVRKNVRDHCTCEF